jgi:ferredoxin
MNVKRIIKSAFTSFVDEIIGSRRVIGVQAKGDKFDFDVLESARDLRLDYDRTIQSPKQYFLPPAEPLLTFEVGGGYESVFDDSEFVLIGVHPYDMVALNQMDRIFSQDNYDAHYMRRRNIATIIATDVVTPSKNVFAASMGAAVVKEGFDILLTDIGDVYIAEIATPKGELLSAKAHGAISATQEDLKRRQKVWAENEKKLNKHQLKCKPSDIPRLLDRAYEHPVWEEKAKTCFSCGSCNLVCPTCYCFNVQDDINWDMRAGNRQRVWDGCLLDGFAKVAGGHDFRKNRADRFRHRLYRKGKYVPDKIGGEIACVGCGRCVDACLPDIANPVNVYNRLVDDLGLK